MTVMSCQKVGGINRSSDMVDSNIARGNDSSSKLWLSCTTLHHAMFWTLKYHRGFGRDWTKSPKNFSSGLLMAEKSESPLTKYK